MTEPSERDREMARKIAQEVAELPGRTSLDDEPDMMFVTQDEIQEIARCYLAVARAEGAAEMLDRCARIVQQYRERGYFDCEGPERDIRALAEPPAAEERP